MHIMYFYYIEILGEMSSKSGQTLERAATH